METQIHEFGEHLSTCVLWPWCYTCCKNSSLTDQMATKVLWKEVILFSINGTINEVPISREVFMCHKTSKTKSERIKIYYRSVNGRQWEICYQKTLQFSRSLDTAAVYRRMGIICRFIWLLIMQGTFLDSWLSPMILRWYSVQVSTPLIFSLAYLYYVLYVFFLNPLSTVCSFP
jgi:hypothetical protein